MTQYDITYDLVLSDSIEADSIEEAADKAEERLGEEMEGLAITAYVNPGYDEENEPEEVRYH